MENRINTGLMDCQKQYIHTCDTLIVGDDPDKHIEYLVYYSESDLTFWASEQIRENFKISRKLETIHANAWIKPANTNTNANTSTP